MNKVQLTKTIQTKDTGVVLPAGAIGEEVQQCEGFYLIHFKGLASVVRFPVDSTAIKRGRNER